ncbi:Vascular endothelial growth factor receptor 1 [Portunus trituberculatus]|uniref:Platelet-derived growth factor receptor-like protein n=1 Tax=Portunus trituberculatus TaxID=210409 RepID=A0A5B7E4T1_PORTR|nr:Vascular endothelial growth factor receptor 1 [Portunus trituberculatus]
MGASKAVLGKPEIFPNRSEIVLEAGESLNLTCRAAHPVAWCSDHKFTTEHYEELYDETDDKAYISTLTIDAVNTSHVGYFSCVFNTSENRESNNCNVSDPSITSLYLFVKDLENFMVTLQNGMVLHTQVGESVVLPCRPTFPQTCESWEDCSYDPREGFTVWINEEYTHFTCIPVYYDRELAWIDIIIRAQKS